MRRLLPIFVLLASSILRADTLVLKNGKVLEGEVLKQDEHAIELKVEYGSLLIPMNIISKIEEDTPEKIAQREEKTEAIKELAEKMKVEGKVQYKGKWVTEEEKKTDEAKVAADKKKRDEQRAIAKKKADDEAAKKKQEVAKRKEEQIRKQQAEFARNNEEDLRARHARNQDTYDRNSRNGGNGYNNNNNGYNNNGYNNNNINQMIRNNLR